MLPSREPPAVPEVAVHQDHEMPTAEDKVWPAWEVPGVLLKLKAVDPEHGSNNSFRACVLAADPPHQLASLLGRHDVTSFQRVGSAG